MEWSAQGRKPVRRVVKTRLILRASSGSNLFKGRDE